MIFQGPIAVDWRTGSLEDGALENSTRPNPRRLAGLLSANVHVAGRPEWLFVKTHTHAMQNRASYLSPANDAMFAAMETWWNRPPFRLHYVTAREAYNIVKAAEAGCSGDPNAYRDYLIPPPANRVIHCDLPWLLHSLLVEAYSRRSAGGRRAPGWSALPADRCGRWPAGCARWRPSSAAGELVGPARIEGDEPFGVDCESAVRLNRRGGVLRRLII